jgi:hypothetical protein
VEFTAMNTRFLLNAEGKLFRPKKFILFIPEIFTVREDSRTILSETLQHQSLPCATKPLSML